MGMVGDRVVTDITVISVNPLHLITTHKLHH